MHKIPPSTLKRKIYSLKLEDIQSRGRLRSGQTQQTVNLSAQAFGGSNPSLPTDVEPKSLLTVTGFFYDQPDYLHIIHLSQ